MNASLETFVLGDKVPAVHRLLLPLLSNQAGHCTSVFKRQVLAASVWVLSSFSVIKECFVDPLNSVFL